MVPQTEAFQVEDYMEQVELWFRKYEMSHPQVPRKIYLATDEPAVIEECREKYPKYTVYASIENAKSASKEDGDRSQSPLCLE